MILQVSPKLMLNTDEVLQVTNDSGGSPSVVIHFRGDHEPVEKRITGADAEKVWHHLQLFAAQSWPAMFPRATDKQRADLITLLANALKDGSESDAAQLAEYVLYTVGLGMHPDPQSA